LVARGLLVVIALALPAAAGSQSRTPLPVVEKARAGTQCIADPATMRRDHMKMLEHQRDQTVHGGIRGAKASLKGCIDCHASPTTGSVAQAETDFCVSCHTYAAVKIDCFECHATKPAVLGKRP
jgi:predicted CXXCH cytochrome family protein